MYIAITGGTGYIGSTLFPKLISKCDRIDLLDKRPPVPQIQNILDGKRFKYIGIDVSDQSRFKRLARRYDVVIHLAALVGYPACMKAPRLAIRSNVGTTKSILKFKKPSCKILFSSTISNYGPQSGLVTESTKLNPTSIYGKSKQRAEELIHRAGNNIVFRLSGAFGYSPQMRDDNLIHDFVAKAVFGTPTSIYQAHFVRQFIHVEDITNAMCFALDHWDNMAGEIYNVGNPSIEITKRSLVQKIQRYCPMNCRFEESGFDPEKRNYRISFDKLKRKGFEASFSLDAGLRELVQHYALDMRAKQQPIFFDIPRSPAEA